jgi:caspase domain-containing protein
MTNWALIIAIQDYPNIVTKFAKELPETNATATNFRDWVKGAKNVPAANIIACAGPDCTWRSTGTTRAEIVEAFNNLAKKARDNIDELYVFFSGHGISFSEDPSEPAIDVLIGSDFIEPSESGAACLRFQEIKETLRTAMGPGKHFYFIDACRNPVDTKDIGPAVLDKRWGRSRRGNATTYVFFSAAPGDVANVRSGFGNALLGGLKGTGRAKSWAGGRMYVTFESLRWYLQRTLGKNDLDPEKRGPADGNIVELTPIPISKCELEVIDAGATDQFTLKVEDVRMGQRSPVTFVGRRKTVPLPPEDYLLSLTNVGGHMLAQIDPPVDSDGVDLYEDRTVRFSTQLPGPPPPQGPLTGLTTSIRIAGVEGTELLLRHVATGSTKMIKLGTDELLTGFEPGFYKAHLKDGNYKLASRSFSLSRGATLNLDFTPKVSKGAHLSLSNRVQTRGPLIDFSETLSNVPDWNLSLWLAVLGGSRIMAAPDAFSKLRSIELESFTNATPGRAMLYVLAGELDEQVPACDIGTAPSWKQMRPVTGVDGLFEQKQELELGPQLVTYAAHEQETSTVLVYGVPNRTTLLTVAHHERQGRQIQQFILPTHSLIQHISPRESEYLQYTQPLQLVRYMSTAQRLFALQSPIEGYTYQGSDRYWFDLLYHKWLDPIMALIACYELIRRGSAERQLQSMREVLSNMRQYFPGFADTEIIAMLLDDESGPLRNPPLLMDGVIAIGASGILPLPREKLEFNSIWTLWRNVLSLTKAEPLMTTAN